MSNSIWPPRSWKYLQEQLLPAFPFENSHASKRLFRELFPATEYFSSTLLSINLLTPFMFSQVVPLPPCSPHPSHAQLPSWWSCAHHHLARAHVRLACQPSLGSAGMESWLNSAFAPSKSLLLLNQSQMRLCLSSVSSLKNRLCAETTFLR